MKQEERREQTMKLLLDTTEELILEKGCTKTTLSDIMARTGLSKGAIFHYVSGKDELFVKVLEAKLEETNTSFMDAVDAPAVKEFDGPMNAIAQSLPKLESRKDVSNLIMMYLIGKSDQPEAAGIVADFYRQAVATSRKWIVTGQESGVIPSSVNADQAAELFELLSFGLRMRSLIGVRSTGFGIQEFSELIMRTLRPDRQGGAPTS
ncbi:TetR/AcrR family transcriptional regulator [Paenibacillus sp. Y412MC10]|uniref:TetR/AcrR family transcriptional regulator n=1 Tax=Geobacillus sp. (strain Y412MC10) TaxID=481743 RepID=UPI0011AB7A38|nr:TetR/AcrR family transcriptional regulator [Paenibacillus sp. Y412MC10]